MIRDLVYFIIAVPFVIALSQLPYMDQQKTGAKISTEVAKTTQTAFVKAVTSKTINTATATRTVTPRVAATATITPTGTITPTQVPKATAVSGGVK